MRNLRETNANAGLSQNIAAAQPVSGRRAFIMGAGAVFASGAVTGAISGPFAAPAYAQGLSSILGNASDSALNKLAQPGAFYNDEAIRIKLPLVGDLPSRLLGGNSRLGGALGGLLGGGSGGGIANILGSITERMNDAAGVAAGEAKPIFRASIDELSLSDAPGIIRQNDGATRYLRESAGENLHGKLRPLVDNSMNDIGLYEEIDQLGERSEFVGQAGLTRDNVGKSITEQALDGIFAYIGNEEAKFRANPLEKAGGLLRGILR